MGGPYHPTVTAFCIAAPRWAQQSVALSARKGWPAAASSEYSPSSAAAHRRHRAYRQSASVSAGGEPHSSPGDSHHRRLAVFGNLQGSAGPSQMIPVSFWTIPASTSSNTAFGSWNGARKRLAHADLSGKPPWGGG